MKKENDIFVIKSVMPENNEDKETEEPIYKINEDNITEILEDINKLMHKKKRNNKEETELYILCLLTFNVTPQQLKEFIKWSIKNLPKDFDFKDKELFRREMDNLFDNRVINIGYKE